ncbi:MAG: hypothetical protein QM778_12130 [Myxococcales bacterium]
MSTMIATLTGIDRIARIVTMKIADGTLSAVAVGDDVVFGRMETGDRVRVDREESLAFQILKPGHAFEDEVYTGAALPDGVVFGRRVATTVEILAVARGGASTTFRCRDGTVHTMDIEAASIRAWVARLHPGDDVEVTCIEKLDIALVR